MQFNLSGLFVQYLMGAFGNEESDGDGERAREAGPELMTGLELALSGCVWNDKQGQLRKPLAAPQAEHRGGETINRNGTASVHECLHCI